MHQLTEVLQQATAAITRSYFHLPIDGGDPILRERVYCYELYHQMRLIWPRDTPFTLNGEVDKQGHPRIRAAGARAASPDFLVHIPGSMAGNHAIIEIKPGSTRSVRGVVKDIWTLSQYRRLVRYQRAIYLFYESIPYRLLHEATAIVEQQLGGLEQIELWRHEQPGVSAVPIGMLEG